MFNAEVREAIQRVADRYGVDATLVEKAIANERAEQLAEVLGLSLPEAQERMVRVARVLSVQADWGAGCALLTDDVAAELVQAIDQI